MYSSEEYKEEGTSEEYSPLSLSSRASTAPLAAPEGSLAPLDSWLLAGSPSALRLRCAVYLTCNVSQPVIYQAVLKLLCGSFENPPVNGPP
jgi:hypothetical protein